MVSKFWLFNDGSNQNVCICQTANSFSTILALKSYNRNLKYSRILQKMEINKMVNGLFSFTRICVEIDLRKILPYYYLFKHGSINDFSHRLGSLKKIKRLRFVRKRDRNPLILPLCKHKMWKPRMKLISRRIGLFQNLRIHKIIFKILKSKL